MGGFMAEFEKLGEFLRKRRVESGYTQAEVASALGGIHSQFVSNWERGTCSPPGHSFHTLIKLLKINQNELVEIMVEDARSDIKKRIFRQKLRSGKRRSA
jgi:transcriptional regulator with XRE-family HTH domain